MTAQEVVERHRSLGRPFDAGAIRSFVREEGSGEPVVCLHGVPMSSFLFRRAAARAGRARPARCGLRPARPGLRRPGARARLQLDRAGGLCPGGRRRAGTRPLPPGGARHRRAGRVRAGGGDARSGPIADGPELDRRPRRLQAPVDDGALRAPRRAVRLAADDDPARAGERSTTRRASSATGRCPPPRSTPTCCCSSESTAGRSFLRVMRGFERTAEKSALYASALRGPYPVQVVWGEHDPALKLVRPGREGPPPGGPRRDPHACRASTSLPRTKRRR